MNRILSPNKVKKGEDRISTPTFTSLTLKEVKCGQTVTVSKLEGTGPIRRRIMDMGITKGTSVFVRKVAPFGDPIELKVRGYELSLRKEDAEKILVLRSAT